MGKRIIRLTSQELKQLIEEAVSSSLNEIDGKTYSKIHNATVRAQQNQLNNVPSSNRKKTNLDVINQGIKLDPQAADSLITPYKTNYLFHCQNLRGAAAITIFSLESLYSLQSDKAILRGGVVFNNESLSGSIVVDMSTKRVFYSYRNRSPKYELFIDPSKKSLWNALVEQLELALKSRTI